MRKSLLPQRRTPEALGRISKSLAAPPFSLMPLAARRKRFNAR
jgi:hypothetical protein